MDEDLHCIISKPQNIGGNVLFFYNVAYLRVQQYFSYISVMKRLIESITTLWKGQGNPI